MGISNQGARPKYLDLRRIKLPITGIVSIAHRISGVVLVGSIPVWLYFLDLSLSSPEGYQQTTEALNGFFMIVFSLVSIWALVHHLLAGIRFLLIDIDIGVEKYAALKAAKLVFIAEALVMLLVIGWWL